MSHSTKSTMACKIVKTFKGISIRKNEAFKTYDQETSNPTSVCEVFSRHYDIAFKLENYAEDFLKNLMTNS